MVTMLIQMLMSSRSIGLLLAVVIISGSACGRFDVLTPAVIGFASEEANKVSEELINPPPEELGAVSVIVERAGYNSEPTIHRILTLSYLYPKRAEAGISGELRATVPG